MCGRYVASSPPEVLARFFEVDEVRGAPEASWNVAPTDTVPAVIARDGRRLLGPLRWGLVPPWAQSPAVGARMINARAETVARRAAYRVAFLQKRCILAADGFYEWERRDGARLPWYITSSRDEPLAMAGLWETWPRGDETLRTCAVVTVAADEWMAPLHDRMPALLDAAGVRTWLDPSSDAASLAGLLGPVPAGQLVRWPVSTRVNSVRNDDPGLTEPCAAAGTVDAR